MTTKANFTPEFMTALLSCAMGDTDKLAGYIEECRQMGIEVLPPDLNESDLDFMVLGPRIRFGLGAIKGVGDRAVQHILDARRQLGGRFTSLFQFCEHVDPRFVDRKVVEQLIKCGAFDSTGAHRAQLMEAVDHAVRLGASRQAERRIGQLSIFDAAGPSEGEKLPDTRPWPQEALLSHEKEALGCYVTSNPLLRHQDALRTFSTATIEHLRDMEEGTEVTIGGILSGLRSQITKTGKHAGQKYVTFHFSDLTGSCEGVCFASDFERNRENLLDDEIVFVTGRVGFREDDPSLRVSQVTPIEKAREVFTGSVRLLVSSSGLEEDLLLQVQEVIRAHPGSCPVFFEVETPQGRRVLVKTANEHFVSVSGGFIADIEEVLGSGHVKLAGKPTR